MAKSKKDRAADREKHKEAVREKKIQAKLRKNLALPVRHVKGKSR